MGRKEFIRDAMLAAMSGCALRCTAIDTLLVPRAYGYAVLAWEKFESSEVRNLKSAAMEALKQRREARKKKF